MRTLSTRLLTLAALATLVFGATPYRDPQGRFQVSVPAGWHATALGADSVQIANGAAYATLLVAPGDDARAMLESIARQTGAQWRGFAEARRGETKLALRPGLFVTYTGTNPRGAAAYLQMIAMSAGGTTYVLMSSAPQAEYANYRAGFDAIERSFGLLVAASKPAPVESSVPAPAQAKRAGAVPAASTKAATVAPKAAPAVKNTPAKVAPPVQTPPPATQAKPALQQQTQPGARPNYYHMQRAEVIDRHGFERPMRAMTLLIPTDWRLQGDVQYTNYIGCPEDLAHPVFTATRADSQLAVELMPRQSWQWAADQNSVQLMQTQAQQTASMGAKPCAVMPVMTAREYIERIVVPSRRRGARVLGAEPMSDVAEGVAREARKQEAALNQQGVPGRIRTDAARVKIAYTANGVNVEEWITAVTYALGTPGPAFDPRRGGLGQTTYFKCGAYLIYGLRANAGQLDAQDRFFKLMLGTVQMDPQWSARVAQVVAKMSADNSAAAMKRAEIARQSGKEIGDIIHSTYENKRRTDDRVAEQFSQYIRGVESYRNPATGDVVELSNGYNHAWMNGRNEYILTDSPNFNPNQALHGNWTPLEPVRR